MELARGFLGTFLIACGLNSAASLDCYGCIYSADSEYKVLNENVACLVGRMNSSYLFPEHRWNSSKAGFANAYGNGDAIIHHMRYHYFNIPDDANVTSCIKVVSWNPNYILRHWTKMAPATFQNSCVRYGDEQTVCFCSQDGCNGAEAREAFSVYFFLAVAAAVTAVGSYCGGEF